LQLVTLSMFFPLCWQLWSGSVKPELCHKMKDIVWAQSEQEVPPPNCTPTTGSLCTEGNAALESCCHYDSFMIGCVTGMKTAGRIRMAIRVTWILLDVVCLWFPHRFVEEGCSVLRLWDETVWLRDLWLEISFTETGMAGNKHVECRGPWCERLPRDMDVEIVGKEWVVTGGDILLLVVRQAIECCQYWYWYIC